MPDTLTDRFKRLPVEVRTEFEEFKARRPDLAAVADALIVTGASIWSIFPLDAALPRAAAPATPAAPAPAAVSATPAPSAAIEMLKASKPELATSIGLMADAGCSLEAILALVNSYSPNPKAPAASGSGWDAAVAQVNKLVALERGVPSVPAAVYASPPATADHASSIAAQNWDDVVAEVNKGVAAQRGTTTTSTSRNPSSGGWDEAISEVNAGVAKQPGGSAARNRSFAA